MSSFTKMQELAVDLSSSGIKFQNESEAIDLTKIREIKIEEVRDSLDIDFSNKIVGILEHKCESHNEAYERKVTLSQLKDVYRGTWDLELQGIDCSINKFALARVGMFSKMVGERKITNSYRRVEAGLIDDRDLDMSPNFYPDEEDFILAENSIREHGLNNYNLNDVDDLYLETEEEIKAQRTDWLGEMIN
ncbi:hypothetical protein CMI37_05150 [Candidatus Pacearchaeota archaeon]|nr:hypothetical protein [Candidatus Pacearchaeota archaeon]